MSSTPQMVLNKLFLTRGGIDWEYLINLTQRRKGAKVEDF
jgi:hypothetical protein